MRFIQHKREALWFYRFLSPLYDRWVNPLFWTEPMRERALALARLDERSLPTLDVGAGTGFATEGVVRRVGAEHVVMLDQSPAQLGRAARKPALAGCERILGDAEELPFADGSFDRYVSCGSIEYWPDPQRAIAEAYRVLRPGGVAMIAGPLPPRGRAARLLADAWMLFPEREEYAGWMEAAGFEQVEVADIPAPWQGDGETGYAVAVAGVRGAGEAPALPPPAERLSQRATPRSLARFVAGSAAGAAFVPVGLALRLRARRR